MHAAYYWFSDSAYIHSNTAGTWPAGDMMIHRHRRMKGLARPKCCEMKAMSSIEPCLGDQFRVQSLRVRFNATDVDARTFGKTAIV